MLNFKDKVVMITGASEGIGAACVEALRARGARLSLNSRSVGKLAAIATPADLATPGDITLSSTRESFVTGTLERFGRIDVLINNAGHGIYGPVSASPEAATRALFELNLFAPLFLTQLVVPHLRAHRSGMVVNIGSIAGKVTLPWMPVYSASKFALGSLTDGLRAELALEGIHAMLVCPGYVKTDFQAHAPSQPPPGSVASAKRFAITPAQCAADILHGMERRANVVMTPRWGSVLVGLSNHFPNFIASRMNRINKASERS